MSIDIEILCMHTSVTITFGLALSLPASFLLFLERAVHVALLPKHILGFKSCSVSLLKLLKCPQWVPSQQQLMLLKNCFGFQATAVPDEPAIRKMVRALICCFTKVVTFWRSCSSNQLTHNFTYVCIPYLFRTVINPRPSKPWETD